MSKGGRPTKYKKEYPELLILHMEEGLSFEAFGGVVRVSKQTLYDWEKAHPEFLDAKRVGESLARLYWEKIARDKMYNETFKDDDGMTVNRSASAPILIFNLKNRLGWRDKQPDELAQEEGERPLRELTDLELLRIVRGNGK